MRKNTRKSGVEAARTRQVEGIDALAELAALKAMTVPELQEKWQAIFGERAPNASRGNLELRLGYRIQELAHGGLRRETRRTLDALAEEVMSGKGETYPGMHEPIVDAELWEAAHAVLSGNRNQRAGRTRSTEPALLRGLIFTETGAAMTPHHTKKGNRRYCYYVSMDVIQKRPTAALRGPQRLPAAMVEEAVIGEIRRLLRTPEIIARTARALKKERPDLDEGTVTAALRQFDDPWKALIPAEQARVVQLLVARVTVGEDGLDIDLRHDGLGALASLMTPAREDAA